MEPSFHEYGTVVTEAAPGEPVNVMVRYHDNDIPVSFVLSEDGTPYMAVSEDINWHLMTVPLSHKPGWTVTVMAGPKQIQRSGPGRPPKPEDERKVRLGVTLSPATVAHIKQQQRPRESFSAALERLIGH